MSIVTVAAKRILPDFEARLRLRRLINIPLDAYDWFTARRDPLTPPRGLWFVGGRKGYKVTNEQHLSYFIGSGLRPEHAVLDIGCGIGVMAARFAHYLTTGSYDGFDIVKLGTDWATEHIGKKHPNFRFQHADIYNRHYNPNGKIQSEAFVFPYADDGFDFAFAKSVFTHMLRPGVEHYLRETSRVLKPSGMTVVTAFLINETSASLIAGGKSTLRLTDAGEHWVLDPAFPETAVGFRESHFIELCKRSGFQVTRIDYGSWCGRSSYVGYQDLVTLSAIAKDANRKLEHD